MDVFGNMPHLLQGMWLPRTCSSLSGLLSGVPKSISEISMVEFHLPVVMQSETWTAIS